MKKQLLSGIAAMTLVFGMVVETNASLVSNEDFESGASGWNNNTVTNGGATFSNFLGRFGGSGGTQSVFKTYTLSGNQTQVTVGLDIYEIDSWDSESFQVYANDSLVATFIFSHGVDDSAANSLTKTFPADSGTTDYGFAGWPDQGYHYSFTFATTATSFKLGFGSTLNQGIADESWGVDNIRIESDAVSTVPEPTSMLLFGLGLVGLAAARIKTRKQ